ncbi:iron donor protein CyaY [Enterovibrio nigricans]|uniref:Iron-sulfur cluster assembly protein CyaY n=1 Tax=Enterovibrio nigricans DSM 22720 TaxID=1121868 RepID=A0A1T4U9T6_9GAMM|nr:iron donor protein CyaY [Enterovibrio nigricans]PKF51366.1 iron donor protein CyaY [Enterovibrio nigricans]SKA49427.1 CyaY protein [Enterovibrio nigricans DSM 22720]
MNTSQYHDLVDAEWMAIEEGIDESGADIDYETNGNVLTLEFENRSQIIINRQEPMSEIWLASKSGGFHFAYKDGQWLCSKTGVEFKVMVKEECSKHAGEAVDW